MLPFLLGGLVVGSLVCISVGEKAETEEKKAKATKEVRRLRRENKQLINTILRMERKNDEARQR